MNKEFSLFLLYNFFAIFVVKLFTADPMNDPLFCADMARGVNQICLYVGLFSATGFLGVPIIAKWQNVPPFITFMIFYVVFTLSMICYYSPLYRCGLLF